MPEAKSRYSKAAIACLFVAIGATLLAGCSPSDEAKPVNREASGTDIAGAVVKGAFFGYKKLKACLANQKIGEPCAATDASNIRRTLEEVKELSAQIKKNQAEMNKSFSGIINLLIAANKAERKENLTKMEQNTEAAGKAYKALADCATTTDGKCRPYNGKLGPEQDVSGAIEETERYFSLKAEELPKDLLTTSAWFTGTEREKFKDGLADASWRYNKGVQDAQAGVSTTAQTSETVPVVGAELAREQNIDLTYWKDVFSEYAFFLVMFVGQSQGEADAKSFQNEADENIASMDRGSVFGSAKHYSLPEFRGEDRGMILAEGNRAWILQLGSQPAGYTHLAPKDVAEMAQIVNTYGSVESFEQVPNTMPPERLYRVRAPIEKVDYKRLGYVAGGTEGEPINVPILKDTTVHWLDENSQDDCPTKVKPLNEPEPRQKPGYGDGLDWSDPEVDPANRIQATWERYVKDQPIAYTWDLPARSKKGFEKLGWGAWVSCGGGPFNNPDSRFELDEVPAVMGPAG